MLRRQYTSLAFWASARHFARLTTGPAPELLTALSTDSILDDSVPVVEQALEDGVASPDVRLAA